MDVAWWLTEVHGPRLTNSPQMRAAADWTVKKLTEWGLANVKLEPWGADAEFGRGWSNERTVLHVTKPSPWPVLAYARAWTPGTNGLVTADAVLAPLMTEADFDKFRGKLKGRIVLLQNPRAVAPLFEAPARRLTEQNLEEMESQQVAPPQAGPGGRGGGGGQQFGAKRNAFLLAEGVAAVLEPANGRGDSGSLLVGSGGSRNPKDPPVPPQLAVATEHYNRIARLLERGQPVTLEADIRNTFHDRDLTMFNIIAEIPGTDRADEVVMLGAHFDSWHAGTGSVDNASGSAVMLEAMRILKQSGVRLRRTVRMGLWTGEEQGLIGSRMYVRNHFADPADMKVKPEHAQAGGLLQHGQRHRPVPRRLSAGERSGRAHLPRLDGALREPGDDPPHDSQHRRHRSPLVQRRRSVRLPVHSGSGPVLEPDPPLEPRPLRPADSVGPDEERGHHRGVRLSHGQSRAAVAA